MLRRSIQGEREFVDTFLDTSVVVRFLTGEPPEMAIRAGRIISEVDNLLVTDVTLMETAHVMRTQYQSSREDTVDSLIDFVQRDNISVYGLDKNLVLEGLMMCRPSGRVSIADAMIWAAARSAGARTIYTFDRRFPDDGIELRQSV